MKYSEFAHQLQFEKLEKKLKDSNDEYALLTYFLRRLRFEYQELNAWEEERSYYGKADEIARKYFPEGVQNRERIVIAGFEKKVFPEPKDIVLRMKDILESQVNDKYLGITLKRRPICPHSYSFSKNEKRVHMIAPILNTTKLAAL